jgi:hypothetical protein
MANHSFDAPTAALAAVADREEAIQAGVLEPRRMHMSATMLGRQQLEGFILRQPMAVQGMVLKHEVNKRLPKNHADLCRLAGIGARQAARALEDDDLDRNLQ